MQEKVKKIKNSIAVLFWTIVVCDAQQKNDKGHGQRTDKLWTHMHWFRNVVNICDGNYARSMIQRKTFLAVCTSVADYLLENGF